MLGGIAKDDIPIAARMLSLRVLSNMFVHPHSRRCILSHSSRVSGTVQKIDRLNSIIVFFILDSFHLGPILSSCATQGSVSESNHVGSQVRDVGRLSFEYQMC